MTTTALVETPATALPSERQWHMIIDMGQKLVASGLLPTTIKKPEAAAAIILKGRELGIPAMQAFSHIHVIQGKPTCSSELMLALLARGGVTWDWISDGSQGSAEIVFRRAGFGEATGRYTIAEARTAKLTAKDTWKNFESNMLRARAISNGARMIGPDLLSGMSYTPEEMGVEVDEDEKPYTPEYTVETAAAAPAVQLTPKQRAQFGEKLDALKALHGADLVEAVCQERNEMAIDLLPEKLQDLAEARMIYEDLVTHVEIAAEREGKDLDTAAAVAGFEQALDAEAVTA
jgi:hypothetical protein